MEEDIKILGEYENINLISLLRTFKREGIENFIVVRREKLETLIKGYRELEEENRIFALARSNIELKRYVEKNYIPKSKIKEKIEELESKIKATFCKYMTEEDYYNNKFLSSDVAEDYEVLEVRELISNRNLLQELMEE